MLFTTAEQPMKPEDMAALDVDSSQSDFLQQEEGRGSQVRSPSRDYDSHCSSLLRFQVTEWCLLKLTYFKLGGGGIVP